MGLVFGSSQSVFRQYPTEVKRRTCLCASSFSPTPLPPDPLTDWRPGGVKNALMNVGSGPIIYQLLGPCKIFKEITASDYRDWNCQELQNWLKNELESDSGVELKDIEFSVNEAGPYFAFSFRENWAEKEAKLSRIIKQVLKCDLHKSNSLDTVILLPTDSLVSSLCLEAACKDLSTY
ncbi:nicotinamide N-methyltransferase-like [Gopherus evgoodei]|uniref:nicotinamide N-methyltransferase-like n=1 Tax=Gopherus evgoodei TaxID=1825980 RepID=UPI0011CF4BD6|nr:nicotinamide N-methyltransferase-like [Gopherus evgoodei]